MILPLDQQVAFGRTFIDLEQDLIAAIIQTIDAGWELALERAECAPNANEVTITECLRDAMRNAVSAFPWRKSVIVAAGTESRSVPGMTAPDGRTDIPLYLIPIWNQSGEHDPHAIIECKRVAERNRNLSREYVIAGIDRFKIGKYASNHGRGFMIGYVLSGTRDGAVSGINSYLVQNARDPEVLERVVLGLVDGWVSTHVRPKGSSPIKLHHAMLPFPN